MSAESPYYAGACACGCGGPPYPRCLCYACKGSAYASAVASLGVKETTDER